VATNLPAFNVFFHIYIVVTSLMMMQKALLTRPSFSLQSHKATLKLLLLLLLLLLARVRF
jgi:hypothetical protein